MKGGFGEALARGGLLLDGAMGTELLARGLALGESSALWNESRPEVVLEVHRAYARVGAAALTTNTFAASGPALARHGAEARLEAINRRAVRLAREAGAPWTLGCVGPVRGWVEARRLTDAEVAEAVRRQAAALLAEGADAVAIETISDPEELVAAVRGAREAGAGLVLATMAFRETAGAFRTFADASLEEAAGAMDASGADAVGANCALRPEAMERLLTALRPRVRAPMLLRPNGGEPGAYDVTPEAFAASVPRMLRAGAAAVGGCCGVGPEHVARARRMLDDSGLAESRKRGSADDPRTG